MALIDWQNLLTLEIIKIKTKGPILVTSLCTYLLFIYLVPLALNSVYHLFPYEDPYKFFTVGTFLSHFLPYVFMNLFFFTLYYCKIPAIEKFKVTSDPWPWENNPKFNEVAKRALKIAIVNQLIITPMYLSVAGFISKYDMTPQEPDFIKNFKQFAFFVICEDFAFFWTHRALHIPYLYKRIHKQHHEFVSVISVGAEHTHPIEYVFGNVLSAAVGPMLLGKHNVHIITWFAWIAFKTQSVAQSHSGYDLPINPVKWFPFGGSPTFHDYHHSVNIGNYGSNLIIWDTLLGSHRYFCKAAFEGKIKAT